MQIDFGGQWLMGRMLVTGRGRELYHYPALWATALPAYPRENEDPKQRVSDVEDLVKESFIRVGETYGKPDDGVTVATFAAVTAGTDPFVVLGNIVAGQCPSDEDDPDAPAYWSEERLRQAGTPQLGGPLYPPVNAFLMAPLALGDHPQWSYRVLQGLILVQALLAGLGVSVLTRGRVWWPLATALIIVYPGFKGGIVLGQNPALTLAVVVWGWALLARGHEWAGGAVWGLLVFKPSWAAAFLLAPVLLLRWRFCLAMAGTAALIVAATLPFVGLRCWFEWLAVVREATNVYDTDANWIFLGRDLLGVPRRFLVDFSLPEKERDNPAAIAAGWVLLGTVAALTAARALAAWLPGLLAGRRGPWRDLPLTGPLPGFLLLGGYLCCLHFMYYDVLLSLAGVFVLLDPPGQFLRPGLVALDSAGRTSAAPRAGLWFFGPAVARTHPALTPGPAVRGRAVWAVAAVSLYAVAALVYIEHRVQSWGVGVTVQASSPAWPQVTKRDGRTLKEPEPRATFSTDVKGTPWETFVLLGLWAWTGLKSCRREGGSEP
jgi:hypothetical protein